MNRLQYFASKDQRERYLVAVRAARLASRLTNRELAITAGVPESVLSKALASGLAPRALLAIGDYLGVPRP